MMKKYKVVKLYVLGENPKRDNIEKELEKILCEHGILGWELKTIIPFVDERTHAFYITFEREIKIDFEEE